MRSKTSVILGPLLMFAYPVIAAEPQTLPVASAPHMVAVGDNLIVNANYVFSMRGTEVAGPKGRVALSAC